MGALQTLYRQSRLKVAEDLTPRSTERQEGQAAPADGDRQVATAEPRAEAAPTTRPSTPVRPPADVEEHVGQVLDFNRADIAPGESLRRVQVPPMVPDHVAGLGGDLQVLLGSIPGARDAFNIHALQAPSLEEAARATLMDLFSGGRIASAPPPHQALFQRISQEHGLDFTATPGVPPAGAAEIPGVDKAAEALGELIDFYGALGRAERDLGLPTVVPLHVLTKVAEEQRSKLGPTALAALISAGFNFPRGVVDSAVERGVMRVGSPRGGTVTAESLRRAALGSGMGRSLGAVGGLATFPLFLSGVKDLRSKETATQRQGAGKVVASAMLQGGIKGGLEAAVRSRAGDARGGLLRVVRDVAGTRALLGAGSGLLVAHGLAKGHREGKSSDLRAAGIGAVVGGGKGAVEALMRAPRLRRGGVLLGRRIGPRTSSLALARRVGAAAAGRGVSSALGAVVLDRISKKLLDKTASDAWLRRLRAVFTPRPPPPPTTFQRLDRLMRTKPGYTIPFAVGTAAVGGHGVTQLARWRQQRAYDRGVAEGRFAGGGEV